MFLYDSYMQAIQLELFPIKKSELGYFQRELNWYPQKGDLCKIGRTFAEKLPDMKLKYAMLEEVIVLSIVADKYLVETTEEYVGKLINNGFLNARKFQYLVKMEDLCIDFKT